jgi:hypothetical protein
MNRRRRRLTVEEAVLDWKRERDEWRRHVKKIRWHMLVGEERSVKCSPHQDGLMPCDYCHIKSMVNYLHKCSVYDIKTVYIPSPDNRSWVTHHRVV